MGGRRVDRVSRQVLLTLSEVLSREVSDPRLELLTFTDTRMTPDLRKAVVHYTSMGEMGDREEVAHALKSASGFLQRELVRRLQLRHAPMLEFHFDDSFDKAGRIAALLHASPSRAAETAEADNAEADNADADSRETGSTGSSALDPDVAEGGDDNPEH